MQREGCCARPFRLVDEEPHGRPRAVAVLAHSWQSQQRSRLYMLLPTDLVGAVMPVLGEVELRPLCRNRGLP